MNSIRQIARLNDVELAKCTPSNASWHTDYRDTAYVHIGGLPFELSEGDVLLIASQYGNPTHVNLVRDKETGKSRGFAFLKYEDQRSTDLAVDNLSGAQVLGRTLTVDHARYKMKEGERETVGESGEENVEASEGESESEEESRPMIREEVELAKLMREHDDDDPMKAYLVKEKREEVQKALKKVAISKPKGEGRERERERRHKLHHHRHRSRRGDSEEDERDRKKNGHRLRRRERSDEASEVDESRSKQHPSKRHRSPTPDSDSDQAPRRRRRRSDDDVSDREDDHRRSRQNGHTKHHRRHPRDDVSNTRDSR